MKKVDLIKTLEEGNDVVDLESAKKLKRYGFAKPTYYYYVDANLYYVQNGLKRVKIGENRMNHNKYDSFIFSAPSQHDAAKWLKNPKNHVILIEKDLEVKMARVSLNKNIIMEGNFWDFHPGCTGVTEYGNFNSYAQLASLVGNQFFKETGIQPDFIHKNYKY